MSAEEKKPYRVERHFHWKSRVYSPIDNPQFTDKEAREILAAQSPKPDGKRIKPCIALVAAKPASA